MAIISAPITLLLLAAAGPIEMPPPSKSATALAIFFAVISVVTGTITAHNGGYEGVVVSISPEVPENAQLLFNITKWIRSGSEQLFASSGCHVYLSEVTVLLPQTWTTIGTAVADSPIGLADNISHEDGHIRELIQSAFEQTLFNDPNEA